MCHEEIMSAGRHGTSALPVSYLSKLSQHPSLARRPRIIVLAGPSGSGKTTACIQVLERTRQRGLVVGGLVTLSRWRSGQKVGLDVQDVRTGSVFPLAERTCCTDGPQIGDWNFHRSGICWAQAAILSISQCALLVIDEIGPLELLEGRGWTGALNVLRSDVYGLALVTLRPGLERSFREQMNTLNIYALHVDRANRNLLPLYIGKMHEMYYDSN